MKSPNTPERLREIRRIMEEKFGPEVTKGSLRRTLNEEAFKELYGNEKVTGRIVINDATVVSWDETKGKY